MESNKDYLKNIEGAERRFFFSEVKIEERASEDTKGTIEGYAALYNSRTNLGWFEEEILPGAFDDVLKDDVRVLVNHDPNLIVARSNKGEGTAELFLDTRGLGFRFSCPDTTVGKDLEKNIELKNITQCSFGFSIKEETWVTRDGQPDLRQIKKLERLYDVSPVTFPAYADTSVAKRSFNSFKETEKPEVTEKRMDGYEARHRMLNLKNAKK